MKKRRLLFALLFTVFASAIFAQVAADPNDYFYDDLVIWETMGLVNNLPAARPYPLQLVKSILQTVIEKGDATQSRIAETHYKRFFGKIFAAGTKEQLVLDSDAHKQMSVALSFTINAEIEKLLTASASIDGWATNKLFTQELLPEGQETTKDIIADNAKAGPFWILPSVNSSIAFGTTEYYVNAGLMRGSFGPFHSNGVIVGPQSLHTGQWDFVINKPNWGYNLSLYAISATSTNDTVNYGQNEPAEFSSYFYPDKYVVVHSIEYRPADKLSLSVVEGVVYGGRFDLTYMQPITPLMMNQGLTGFGDNTYLGGMFTFKPKAGTKIDGVLYIDDMSFNDVLKLNLNTRYRIAGQIGASYAPRKSGIFTLISLDYTMITPYTFSHRNRDDNATLDTVNYQNYLHAGLPFGADMQPNSDRVNIRAKFRPLEDLDFDLVGTLIRHGNVNESINQKWVREYLSQVNTYYTDGSMLNDVYTVNAGRAYQNSTPFLTQDTLQYIWQTGFDVLCRLPILRTYGQVVFKLGYRFECNINSGINKPIYKYYDLNGDGKSYDATSDNSKLTDAQKATLDAEAAKQYAAWLNAATGMKINNYISVGFEFLY